MGAATPFEKSGPRWPKTTAQSKVHEAGILLKIDTNAPVCATSKIVFCQMSLSTNQRRARLHHTIDFVSFYHAMYVYDVLFLA